MPLLPGEKLGPYEILSDIGAGGMGEVYRARDTRLDRVVALKISKQEFDERFEREARAVARLNHPNICSLYDVGSNYLVMEFVDGLMLSQRMQQEPIPWSEAEPIVRQLIDAIEVAHEKGIIHRDLKPENIKITNDGVVKVLDFGLAKATDPVISAEDLTVKAGTLAGSIMGTPGYMSPEQARGLQVDKRTDIWAFGVILYEMGTGKRLFAGPTISDTLAAVLTKEVDSSTLPAPIRQLVVRCLERDPKRRLRDIGDARPLLDDPIVTAPHPASRSSRWPWAVVAIALLAALAAGYTAWKSTPVPELVQLELAPPLGAAFDLQGGTVSPDGRTVAFFAGEGRNNKLYLRPLSAAVAQPLEGTQGGIAPFWSPDGRYIAYCGPAGMGGVRPIMKLAIDGGRPQLLGEVPRAVGASWSRSGVILVSPGIFGPLYRLSADGGPVTEATRLEKDETSHRWPHFLPDGCRFLFRSITKNRANSGIYLASLDSNERIKLSDELSNAEYASGHLLYVREQRLVAQLFDPSAGRLSGEPVTILDDITFHPSVGKGSFSVSLNGNLVALRSGATSRQLRWVNRDGKLLETVEESDARILYHRLSPDAKKVAIVRGSRPEDLTLWVLDLGRGVYTALGKASAIGPHMGTPLFSPDGASIAFSGVPPGIHAIPLDGGPKSQRLAPGTWPLDWSRDGKYLAFYQGVEGPANHLWLQPMTDGAKPFPFHDEAMDGRFSPDGKWMAYVSDISGRADVYIAPLLAQSGKGAARIQVSPAGGKQPVWSRDGKELFYLSAANDLMATTVRLQPTLSVGIPKPLFPASSAVSFDVSDDGQRFLMPLPLGRRADPPLTVMLHWNAQLKN